MAENGKKMANRERTARIDVEFVGEEETMSSVRPCIKAQFFISIER